MTMNRSVLVVNHGALSLAPRGIEADVRGNAQDIYSDADHVSSLSLSPPASKPTTVIPGMQEIFTRFSSPPHPSPILAATLGGYNSQSECYVNEMATTRTTSSCVTTPQSLYSDPINSAEGQSNFENSFEASSSSAIDLVDFPSSLMPNALDDFESLGCDPHADHLADEARQAIEGIQPKDCPIQLDDDEMDIVPNELVQFVSESTRRIRCVATSGLSGGDSDLDEMDHDARIASLCLPILQPPSLISSHVSDGMRPPSLSPQSPADGPLVAGNSDDLTAIEFTRAYLSEPADSRSTLSEPKDFETYHSIDPMNEFKTNSDPDVPPCESRTPENQQSTLSSPFARTVPDEITYGQTTYDQIGVKPQSNSCSNEPYFINQEYPKFPNSLVSASTNPCGMNVSLSSNHLMHSLQGAHQAIQIDSNTQLINPHSEFSPVIGINSSTNSLTHVGTTLTSSDLSGASHQQSEVKTTVPLFQNLSAPVRSENNTCTLQCESGPITAKFSLPPTSLSSIEESPGVPNLLLKNAVIDGGWTYRHTGVLSSSCSASVAKPEDSVLSRVTTRVVSAPVLGQSTPLSSSTQPSVTSSILPPGAVQLIAQSTVPSSTPSTFTSPQSSISFLLTTDLNKTNGLSSSLPPTQTTNRNALSYLNLPLQILQALPNLRPGMSILLNVKNERPPGQFGAATSVALESQLSPVFTNSTATTRSDNTVFLLPGSQIPITGTSKIQTPQGVPTQHACHLNSNLGQSVLFMPSVPSSGVSSLLLPCGLNSVPGTNPGGTTNGASSALAAGTQFLLLRSPKPELKIPGLVQASNVSPVTSEMTFLLSTNSTPKVQTKPSLLLIPTAVPSSGPQQTCLFPTITSPLNFQPANPNLLDNSTISSWGYRPPDLQSLLGLNSGSACLQFGVGQPTANVQNTLLAAALNRSISNNLTASTLTFPITVLPTSPQTLLMSPSTSVLQPSSSLNTLLPSPLASSLMSIATQTASMVTTDSSVSSANLDPTSKFPIAAQPGYPSTSIPSNPAPSNTLSTPGTMITCVPAATNNTNPSSVFPPKKLIVLPSADNLLSSCSRSSVLSGSTPTVSVACQQAFKNSDSKVPLLSSYAHRPLSPCVLPSPTGTTSTKSASPVPQSSTTSHVNCRRRHQCPYCPKSCERKDNLQAHIRTHTGERPYPCRFCPKAFPQKDHLRAHIRTHTGEKPYRCPQCMKAFAQLGNLHRHVKTHKR